MNTVPALAVPDSVHLSVNGYQVRYKVCESDLKETDVSCVAAEPFTVVVDDGQECADYCRYAQRYPYSFRAKGIG